MAGAFWSTQAHLAGLSLAACASLVLIRPVSAQELDVARVFDERNIEPMRELYQQGEYERVAEIAKVFIERGQPSPEWWIFRLKACHDLGRVDELVQAANEAAQRHAKELPVLITCHEVLTAWGKKEEAAKILQQINTVAKGKPTSQRTARDMVALGRAALAAGADPQKVIQQFLDPAKKKEAKLKDTYLALGELALAKSDYARAANEFRDGLKHHDADPDLRYGLARAFQSSDRKKSMELVEQILQGNALHPGAHLLKAEHHINAEEYDEARLALEPAIEVNSNHPEGWGLRAVLSILQDNKPKDAEEARKQGLKLWAQNPAVDIIIGRSLSRGYRFKEAEEHLREALKLDPQSLSAKVHLCQALFRLGKEDEAWKVAKEVRDADGYNVQAYNIGLLEAEMKGFKVRETPDFVLKLPAKDDAVYGDRALELLTEAKQVLCAKYGLTLDHPVLVEFFPSQQDFAIRTFGNLGGQGILGACFGSVVTMNSPQGVASNRSNWEGTLWHEFCHVVTLTVTHNRMPRWLSEGISVYEESKRDPSWGMRMNASYRRMTLDEETLTPMSKMSRAFLSPKSSEHVMFAYYESSQAVDWLLKTYGEKKFQAVLKDLADGRRINEALARHCGKVEKLDEDFAKHMRKLAEAFAPKGDWEKPEREEVDPRNEAAIAEYLREHPNNLWALELRTRRLVAGEQWTEGLELAKRLIELAPDNAGENSGYHFAAQCFRGMKQTEGEAAMLREWAKRDGGAHEAFLRLVELDAAAKNWKGVSENVPKLLSIQPFLKQPYELMAQASETLGNKDAAVWALQKLIFLGPDHPVEVNFSLARLLREKDDAAAKRHLLDALAEAPRFRDGHKLLLELQSAKPAGKPPAVTPSVP
ncbi:tetratricopeptide repeat protein [Roseimicrobium gellanilyticum]|uniref:Tetratricopeptide repeat protein n=1 Tax=Roseimicrobium gellanilyticum TaxID=748857 RepID=A0A366HUF3_9BACT|nr:tetratricopeptide repeat protein [Roseimicrobium gellanilyticum]RBP47906.1 tetratricopeptide repeat protein [Roseimicrobium gellanilyticum]